MSYVITDGKRYCHRTKTRAVEIVNDLDSATRFANKDMAQNILQRATKKLSGFSLMELPSVSAKETPAKAKTREQAEKTESTNAPARKGRPAKKQTEAPVTDQQEKQQEKQQAKQEEKLQEKSAPSPKKTEDAASENEEKSGRSETRKKTHRGGRRRKNASQETASAEQVAEQSEKAEETKAEPAKADNKAEKANEAAAPAESSSPKPALPPSFRMEIRGGASGQKAASEKKLPEAAAAPAVKDLSEVSDASSVPSGEAAASEKSSADMTVQQDTPSQPEQNRSRKSGRSRRGGRKNRGESNQQESAQQNADQQETAKQDVNEAGKSSREDRSEAALQKADPEKPAAAPEKPAAAPEKPAAPVIPMFTVKTHHVSENAVARPVRAEQAPKEPSQVIQKQPVSAAMSVPEQAAQVTDDKTLVIETAHVADVPKAGQSTDSGRDSGRSKTTGRSRGGRSGRSRDDQGRESSSARESAEKKSASEAETKSSENSRSRTKGRSKAVSSTESKRRIFTTQERYEIYNRTEGHCGICGKFIPLGEYTIDHIIPLSKGGTNDLDNLQACCSFCNKAKDDSMGDEFFQRIQNIFLYQAQLKFGKKKLKKLKKALDEMEE